MLVAVLAVLFPSVKYIRKFVKCPQRPSFPSPNRYLHVQVRRIERHGGGRLTSLCIEIKTFLHDLRGRCRLPNCWKGGSGMLYGADGRTGLSRVTSY